MLKVNVTGDCMIFAKEYEGKTFYSTSISNKKTDGTYENAYIDVKFKKGVNVPHKTKIEVKNGWLTFYLKDKKPTWQLFIGEFDMDGFMTCDEDDIPAFLR